MKHEMGGMRDSGEREGGGGGRNGPRVRRIVRAGAAGECGGGRLGQTGPQGAKSQSQLARAVLFMNPKELARCQQS